MAGCTCIDPFPIYARRVKERSFGNSACPPWLTMSGDVKIFLSSPRRGKCVRPTLCPQLQTRKGVSVFLSMRWNLAERKRRQTCHWYWRESRFQRPACWFLICFWRGQNTFSARLWLKIFGKRLGGSISTKFWRRNLLQSASAGIQLKIMSKKTNMLVMTYI